MSPDHEGDRARRWHGRRSRVPQRLAVLLPTTLIRSVHDRRRSAARASRKAGFCKPWHSDPVDLNDSLTPRARFAEPGAFVFSERLLFPRPGRKPGGMKLPPKLGSELATPRTMPARRDPRPPWDRDGPRRVWLRRASQTIPSLGPEGSTRPPSLTRFHENLTQNQISSKSLLKLANSDGILRDVVLLAERDDRLISVFDNSVHVHEED